MGEAKKYLKLDSKSNFQIIFTKKSKINSNPIEKLSIKPVLLKENIMEFSNDYVVYKNLNSNNDFIEINFQITSKLIKTKEFPPLTINLNNLVINTLVEEILLFSANTFLKLMYIVTQNENNSDFNENHSNKNKNCDNNNFNKNSSNRDFFNKTPSQNKNNFFSIFHSNLNSSNPFLIKNKLNSNSEYKTNEYNYKTNDNNNNNNNNNFKTPNVKNNNKKGFFSKILSHNYSSSKITNKNNTNDQPTSLLNNYTPSTNNNSSINSYEIIESNSIPDSDKIKNIDNIENKNKNFCVGIFVAGLNKKTSTLIENSNGFPACCNHPECAILQSMTAEILDKYLIKNQKCEINSFLANMCFPLGIKNCYKCVFSENGIENTPSSYKIFMNIISNENNDKFFTVTLQYYRKISVADFNKFYNVDPLKEYMKKNNEIGEKLSNKEISKNFEILGNFLLNKHLLIPESVILISKYPYFKQMEICLKNIVSVPKESTTKIISFLLNEIQLSFFPNSNLIFFLPRSTNPIILPSPQLNPSKRTKKQIIITEIEVSKLFKYFSIEKIIEIFFLILLEQKILFVNNDYKILSEISYLFINIIYPLKWNNIYIPILSLNTIQYLQSFIPFVMGIDEFLLDFAANKKNFINLNKNKDINIIPFNLNQKTKIKYKINKTVAFPQRIYNFINNGLKDIKKILTNVNNFDEKSILNKLQNVFIKTMVMFLGDYKKFVFYSEIYNVPLFNKEGFCELFKEENNKETHMSKFVNEIVNTQNFMQFLLDEKENFYDNNNKYDFNYFIDVYKENLNHIVKRNKSIVPRSISNRNVNNNNSNNNSNKSLTNIRTSFNKKASFSFLFSNNNNNNNLTNESIENEDFHDNLSYNSNNVNNSNLNKNNNIYNNNNNIIEKNYLLFPYFFPRDLIINYIDKKKIEDYIKKNLNKHNYNDVSLNEEHSYIFPIEIKKFNFNLIKDSKKIYSIPIQSPIENITKLIKEINLSQSNKNNNNNLNINNLNEKDKKSILDLFIKIFIKNQTIENFDLIIEKFIYNFEFKIFITNLLNFKIRFYSEKTFHILNEKQFDFLYKISKNMLNYPASNNQFILYKGITLILFSYYKIVKDKKKNINEVFLYENIIKDQFVSTVWLKEDFWKFFVEDEIKKVNNEFLNFDLYKEVGLVMIKLGLGIKLVKKSFLNVDTFKILDEDNYQKLEIIIDSGDLNYEF